MCYCVWVALIELVNATAYKWISAKAVKGGGVEAVRCCNYPLLSNEESATAMETRFSRR